MRAATETRLASRLAGLLAGALMCGATGPALAQTACLTPAERTAFDMRAVQSQLQVAALLCRDVPGFGHLHDSYGRFAQRFRADFATGAQTFVGYWRRSAGSGHARLMDGWVTDLANAQQQDASRQGSLYCPLVAPLFNVALARSGYENLASLANERNILNTMAAPVCPPAPARPAAPPRRAPAR